MDIDYLYKRIKEEIPLLDLRLSEPMRAHSSFRIGGPADMFALIRTEAELLGLLPILKEEHILPTVIGRGTNLLVSDEGLRAFVIKISGYFDAMDIDDNCITAQSGVPLARLAVFAQQNGLGGLEFAHGIPGSLGGAVFMNAGAYGGEMKDLVHEVRYLSLEDCGIHISRGVENDFSYRHSRFSDSGDIIINVSLRLLPRDGDEILSDMMRLYERRSASQPLGLPSAGSTFKRPQTGYAAEMIDKAGLKGFRIGGAAVSEKHAGFIVNDAGATFEDVIAVMEQVKAIVLEKFGVELQPEVKILK